MLFIFHSLPCAVLEDVLHDQVMREMQENYYLVLFMFAKQLYFYVLGPISLLCY